MNFEKLDRFLDDMPQRGLPACSFSVTHCGKPIYEHCVGFSDLEKTKPTSLSDLYWVCSISKVTTCVAAMRLVERGIISLDDPVSKYLPAFSTLYVRNKDKSVSPAKNVMTLEHLFTMTGGLGYGIADEPIARVCQDRNASTLQVVNAMAEVPLAFEPGSHFRYSLCHDVLAAVVEVASGMRFADYVKTHILDPLGMTDTGYHLPSDMQKRMTAMYQYHHGLYKSEQIECTNKYRLTDNYDSGGAGLYTTPIDQLKLLTVLACKGTTEDGYVLLRPETIDSMGVNRLSERARADLFPSRLYGYGWGLCCRAHENTVVSSSLSSVGEFGWDGATGSFALVDPKRQVAMYFALHVFNCQYVYHAVHPLLRDMVYEELNKLS